MAQLVIAAAGSAIGAYISGGFLTAAGAVTAGASWGWIAGSAVGDSYSPRIADVDTNEEPEPRISNDPA